MREKPARGLSVQPTPLKWAWYPLRRRLRWKKPVWDHREHDLSGDIRGANKEKTIDEVSGIQDGLTRADDREAGRTSPG